MIMGKLWRRGENSTWMEVVATWRVAVETWREYDNITEDFVTLNEATRVMMISERRDSSGKVFVLKLVVEQAGNMGFLYFCWR